MNDKVVEVDTHRYLLKIEHYKQRVAELSREYEEKVADLRVQVTILSDSLEKLQKELKDRDGQPDVSEETEEAAS